MAGIYIHIPFCARRCIYCGFFSTLREDEATRYVDAVCLELERRRGYLRNSPVTTIYFGGGTPSRLTIQQMNQLIECINTNYDLANLEELTVECNPDDITMEYVTALRELGVNRISMGVQTFNEDLLHFIGRRHSAMQAVNAVGICNDIGINNVSIDLIYGIPGQTSEMQSYDLKMAADMDVQHISSYCLSYEKGTLLDAMRMDNRIIPVDDDVCAAMYDRMCLYLFKTGFEHYEISNFCRPGYMSRHNSCYWNGTPYLGVGAGAHSYNGKTRQWNPNDIDAYLLGMESNKPIFDLELLSETDIYNEMVMLSLRTSKGLDLLSLTTLDRIFVLRSAEKLISSGYMVLKNNKLCIPEHRMFISDSIISSLFKI